MSSRPPGSEVDGAGVTSGGVDVAPKLSIESGNVAMSQTSRLDNRILAEKDISFIPPLGRSDWWSSPVEPLLDRVVRTRRCEQVKRESMTRPAGPMALERPGNS
jgi:hypothetical protein